MSSTQPRMTTEQESRQLAEESRETEWAGRGFPARALPRPVQLPTSSIPFPMTERGAAGVHEVSTTRCRTFLATKVDSVAIDETGEYPEHVIDGLRKLGAFGMKIPTEYGGLGFTVSEYCKVMEMIGSYDGNITRAALGAPVDRRAAAAEAVRHAGAEEEVPAALRRRRDLGLRAHRAARRLRSREPRRPPPRRDGDFFVLNGEKLWCTNGTLAELLVVMARDPKTKKISAFVVETDWPGVKVEYRCRFMGLKALANGVISFQRRARAAREPDRRRGQGPQDRAHHAQHRPAHPARGLRRHRPSSASRSCRGWANARVQWGVPIWKHEAVGAPHRRHGGHHLRDGLDRQARQRDGRSRRLRHPARGRRRQGVEHRPRAGRSSTSTLQIRGGRGYETENSLKGRGEAPDPGRAHDARLPHQPDLRGLERDHASLHGARGGRQAPAGRRRDDRSRRTASAEKLAAMPKILGFYARVVPAALAARARRRWSTLQRLRARSARTCASSSAAPASSRARASTAWRVYQAKMERKQGFLFRCVDIVMELFAMAATISHARSMRDARDPEARAGARARRPLLPAGPAAGEGIVRGPVEQRRRQAQHRRRAGDEGRGRVAARGSHAAGLEAGRFPHPRHDCPAERQRRAEGRRRVVVPQAYDQRPPRGPRSVL